MKVIYKYQLEVKPVNELQIDPEGEILSVQLQDGKIMMWVLTNPSNKTVLRYFSIYGTGHAIVNEGCYIATVQERGFVWHIFEENL
jgi:hypothetical protein